MSFCLLGADFELCLGERVGICRAVDAEVMDVVGEGAGLVWASGEHAIQKEP